MSSATRKVDVGILTFRDDELAAVQERFPVEGLLDGQRRYSSSRVMLDGGESYVVASSRIVHTTGRGDAAEAVRFMVEDLAPSVILLVGVAATLPLDEITLGDVLIATRVVEAKYDDLLLETPRKKESIHNDVVKWASNLPSVTTRGWHSGAFTKQTPTLPAQPEIAYWEKELVLSSLRQHFSGPWDFSSKLAHTKIREPRVAAGTITVVDQALDDRYLRLLKKAYPRDIIAFESQSLDAYSTARALQVPLMSIRGISEITGLERDPHWVVYACKVAAAFTLAFLKTRPIAPRRPTQHEKSTSEPLPDRPIDLTRTFAVDQLSLSNVRGFPSLDLAWKAPPQGEGQWAILLGENGVGKTTLLRALALALTPADVAPSVLTRAGLVSPTVRAGAKEAVIRVGTPGEPQVTTLRIEPMQGGERLGRRVYADVPMPFVVAYGARRGSGLSGSSRGAELSAVAAVETLFDEGANLIQPDEWLKGWQLAALQGGPDSPDARFFDAILATLCAVLPGVTEIHVSRASVELTGPTLGRVPLGALSDGYRTTMGWILDMIARWAEEAKRRNVAIGGDFHQKMSGVALIDEIDLYLHPRWQRDVISMVRRHFPRMSFVVTTHNPLTLLGAEKGEIHVLRRTEQGEVEVIQRDLPPGADVDQVLTGDWFGLPSTLDDGTLAMLRKHQQVILERGLDSPEAVKLEEQLRRRLGSYAGTSIERLAREAAAKVLGEEPRSLTPDERRDAQEKIAAILATKAAKKPAPRAAKGKATAGKTKPRRAPRAPR